MKIGQAEVYIYNGSIICVNYNFEGVEFSCLTISQKHLISSFVCGKNVLRKGIDEIAASITETYQLDVFDQALFLFFGTRPDQFKALYWEKDGFLLLYKHFENEQLKWSRDSSEVKQIDVHQIKRLLSGFAILENENHS
ncbi:IS66 family insertion sequence element accessory protein TnpB [Enterococcus sp. 669A]|uniref:IS66 family insertion sequence element accessory protein TnpB n=1 Tax=Candidatus Enterococcus moelleringii TaxID=2815325 RepID=A0ABS3L9G8_9ENTE|nr:IS66 family insertion sequence element accessory protein TnpB [Enterococcus sp. 669A]MBO1306242.1 IS66 family insertion sequence element accessory protein TnpB [Enterococcus sp. 669A]